MIARIFRRERRTPAVSLSDRLIASPRVSRATQHGETMLLDLAGGSYYTLNESGAFVWDMLRRGTTLGEIIDALEARYDAPRERIAADASTLTSELIAASLVSFERARQ
jgi:Coenzyme PQQ synthesis protein D (PqqD)